MRDDSLSIKQYFESTAQIMDLIERRIDVLDHVSDVDDEMERNMLLSFIDYFLKWKKNEEEIIGKIMELCSEHGIIPQFGTSGSEAISPSRIRCTENGDLVIGMNTWQLDFILCSTARTVFSVSLDSSDADKKWTLQDYSITRNSEYIAASFKCRDETRIFIIDIRELKVIHSFSLSDDPHFTLSEDGGIIAYSENGVVSIRKGQNIVLQFNHDGPIYGMSFDNDGRKALICGLDTTILNIEEGMEHKLNISCAPDCLIVTSEGSFHVLSGRHLYTIDADGNCSMDVGEIDMEIPPSYFMGTKLLHLRGNEYRIDTVGPKPVSLYFRIDNSRIIPSHYTGPSIIEERLKTSDRIYNRVGD